MVVYNEEATTLKLLHPLPADVLRNGMNYYGEITVYDIDGNSVTSSSVSFSCYTTPTWTFQNLEQNQVLKSAMYTLNISYSQPEGELLNEYQVKLYNSAKSVIWDSGNLYDTNLSVALTGFADSSFYYVQAIGKTIHGMLLDTGLIPFSVQYTVPSLYSLLHLENKEYEGAVKITSNIVGITGRSIPNNITYVFKIVKESHQYMKLRLLIGHSLQEESQVQVG